MKMKIVENIHSILTKTYLKVSDKENNQDEDNSKH